MIRSFIKPAVLCAAAVTLSAPFSANAESATLDQIADYSQVDMEAPVSTASFFGDWFNWGGSGGSHGGGSNSGGNGGGGSTDVPAPPVLLIFGAAAAAMTLRSKAKKRSDNA